MEEQFLSNLDIYEVDKEDYEAYFYRLPKNIMKTTPQEGMVVYKDMTTGDSICGILTENIMAMPANRYFIFNFLEEERLGPHKMVKHITMNAEEYEEFLNKLSKAAKSYQETKCLDD